MTKLGLDAIRLKSFQSVPVHLEGHWEENPWRHDWKGIATSPVPMVALSFLEFSNQWIWCKSEKRNGNLELRLALFPYDQQRLDVGVNFSVRNNGGCRMRSIMPSSSYRPELPDTRLLETAQLYEFATVEGNPAIKLFMLFLARTDVKGLRKGLWRVRSPLLSSVQEPLRTCLDYGRTGVLQRNPAAGEHWPRLNRFLRALHVLRS